MWKICCGEWQNLENWPAEFGKVCRRKLWSLLTNQHNCITEAYICTVYKYFPLLRVCLSVPVCMCLCITSCPCLCPVVTYPVCCHLFLSRCTCHRICLNFWIRNWFCITTHLVLVILVGAATIFKNRRLSGLIQIRLNLSLIALEVITLQLTELDFRYDVIFSRWRSRRHFTQKSVATRHLV